MRVPTEPNTTGGRIVADLDAAGMDWTLGVDYLNVDRDATRYWDFMSKTVTVPQSFMWSDVYRGDLGFFAELVRPIGEQGELTAGLRYDRVEATISQSRANTVPVGPAWVKSPNQLYQAYYGRQGQDVSENNIGGFLRYSHDLGERLSLSGGISRSVRTADAIERYLPSNNMMGAMRWVGNPDLEPEAHHQIDVGLAKTGSNWSTGLDLFYDRVNDFILRDRAHGQSGILQNDNATIYTSRGHL